MKAILNYLPQMAKAFMPIVVSTFLLLLSNAGITEDMSVKEATDLLVNGLLGSLIVWLVPNRKS